MKKYKQEEQIAFDDILLVPQYSEIESRRSVNISTSIGKDRKAITLNNPFIAAPMDTVCDWEMAVAIRRLGGLGMIHRYMSIEDQVIHFKTAQIGRAHV